MQYSCTKVVSKFAEIACTVWLVIFVGLKFLWILWIFLFTIITKVNRHIHYMPLKYKPTKTSKFYKPQNFKHSKITNLTVGG